MDRIWGELRDRIAYKWFTENYENERKVQQINLAVRWAGELETPPKQYKKNIRAKTEIKLQLATEREKKLALCV